MSLRPALDIVREGIDRRHAETGDYPNEWHVTVEIYDRLKGEVRMVCTHRGSPQSHMKICGVKIIPMQEGN